MKSALKTLAGRLDYVARALYGEHGKTTRLAAGLQMSRSQLFEYRTDTDKRDETRDIDAEVLQLIERERSAAIFRCGELRALKQEYEAAVAAEKDRKTKKESRDAA